MSRASRNLRTARTHRGLCGAIATKLLKWKRILVAILERKTKTLTVILEMLRNVSWKMAREWAWAGSRFGSGKVKVNIKILITRSF